MIAADGFGEFPWNILYFDALKDAGRLIWFTVIGLVGAGIVFALCKRPKSPKPTTWAQSMAGAIAVFALMLVGYANIPHEFITYADTTLNWASNEFVWQSGQWGELGNFPMPPFNFTKQALRDIVVVGIYGLVLVINVFLIVQWQKRPVRKEEEEKADVPATAEREPAGTSAYGRPLTTQS